MKTIGVYDTEAMKIEPICEEWNITEAELIEILFQIIEDEDIDISGWI